MTPLPQLLPLLSMRSWQESHSLAEQPPAEVRRVFQAWIQERLTLAQEQLQAKIQQVHGAEEPHRPWITVNFSDGPASFPDPNWVSSQEVQLRERFESWDQEIRDWGDARQWNWVQVVDRWEAVAGRELGFWEAQLGAKLQLLEAAGPGPERSAATERLRSLTLGKSGEDFAAWQRRWRGLQEFSAQLDRKVLNNWARRRQREYGEMEQTVSWGDRLFNLMVGATVFADYYASDSQVEFRQRARAYGDLADRAETGDWPSVLAAFRDLEQDPAVSELLQTYRTDAAVLRYGVGTLLVLLSGFASAYLTGALGLSEGSLLTLGARQLGSRLLVQSSSFVLTHRALSSWVLDEPLFDPEDRTPGERAWRLTEEILLTAAMFYFLGAAQEGFLQAGGARWRPWSRELGGFATENLAFAGWNLVEGGYRHLGREPEAWEAMASGTLSGSAWLDRLLFLTALRLGGHGARGLLGKLGEASEGNSSGLKAWAPARWALPEGEGLPAGILWMSGGKDRGSGRKGPEPVSGKAPKDPDTLTDQRTLDTLLRPGRLQPGDPARLGPVLLEANAKKLSAWEPSASDSSGGVAESFDARRVTRDHWFPATARWVRCFFDPGGRLLQVAEHPGREAVGRGVVAPPRGPGLPVEVLLDPETHSVLWFDHRLGGLGAYLGGRPLDAMAALWQSGRGYRQSLSEGQRLSLAFRVAETMDPRDWHRELLGEYPEGPLLVDLLGQLLSGQAETWTVHPLHLYRERGLLRLGKQVAPKATEHGKVEFKVLRAGPLDPVVEVKRGQLQAGSLSRETLQEYERVMVWLQGKMGEMPTLIQPARSSEGVPEVEVPQPSRWRRWSGRLKTIWGNWFPAPAEKSPAPAPLPVQLERPWFREGPEGLKILSLPPKAKVVLLGGADLARPQYGEACIRITRLEDGTHFLEVDPAGPTILVNDLVVGPGRWVMIYPGDMLTLSPQAVFQFSD